MYVFDSCCFSFAYFAEPVQKKHCILWCLIFSLEQRWCNKHCQIHPHIVKIHEKYNGIIWPWDFLHYFWNSSEHHKLLSWIHEPGDQAEGRCRQFWEHVKHLPFYGELGLESVDHKRTIPLAWHMDGVKVYKTHKAYVYSCSSLIRKGPSLDTKLLVLLIRDGDLVKPQTHNSIAKLVAYIMGVLRTGNFPLVDHEGIPFKPGQPEWEKAGTPFAGGWKAAFAAFKADLEARVMVHQLVRNWASDSICEHCLASKTDDFSYGDFSNRAAYLDHIFTHKEFLLLNPAHKQSSWIQVPGWDKDRNLDDAYSKQHFFVFRFSME